MNFHKENYFYHFYHLKFYILIQSNFLHLYIILAKSMHCLNYLKILNNLDVILLKFFI